MVPYVYPSPPVACTRAYQNILSLLLAHPHLLSLKAVALPITIGNLLASVMDIQIDQDTLRFAIDALQTLTRYGGRMEAGDLWQTGEIDSATL